MKDDTFDTYSISLKVETRCLASKSLEKLVVEPKTLGWEKLSEKFRKWLQKPWSSIYSTEMFSK
jgi:hypothetical protein